MPRKSDGRQAHPNYRTWVAMRQRCRENWPNYEHVSVCPEWDDFWQFVADVGDRPEGLTLDRIDPWGDYEPGNVRWATYSQQNYNRRPFTYPVPEKCRNGHDYVVAYEGKSPHRRCAGCLRERNEKRKMMRREKNGSAVLGV